MDFGGAEPSDMELLLYYSMERSIFTNLIQVHRRDPERMKSVLALWMWLESIGYNNFIRHLHAYTEEIILEFVREAELCLDTLTNQRFLITEENNDLPFTAKQLNEPIELRFFAFNREVVSRGISRVLDSVCRIIFDESRQEEVRKVGEKAVEEVQKGLAILDMLDREANASAQVLPPTRPKPLPRRQTPPVPARSNLNPTASPWRPSVGQTADDHRSMFITFSKGHPISREDISEFFNARYGPCVETVMMEKDAARLMPMYGRIVFTNASMIAVVLNGQRTAKFLIKGRHLWGRMYLPRHSSGGAGSSGGGH